MRQSILIGALAGSLVASGAAAQGTTGAGGQTSDPRPSAQQQDGGYKGYGYGEQPGKADEKAKQEAEPGRARSTAPQDERRSSGSARAAGSATGVDARSVAGRVVKVSSRSLSLRGDDRRVHRLRLDESTRVLREGTEVAVRDLQPGEEVRAAFETRGGRRVATTITLVESGAREPPSHTDNGRESERRQDGAQPAQGGAQPRQR